MPIRISGFLTGLVASASTRPGHRAADGLPSTENAQGMRNARWKPISTGDPWPFRIVADNIGYICALTAEIWPVHPEEFLAVRADWVRQAPAGPPSPCSRGLIERSSGPTKPKNKMALPRCSLPGLLQTRFPALSGPSTPQYKLRCRPEDLQTIPKLGPLY